MATLTRTFLRPSVPAKYRDAFHIVGWPKTHGRPQQRLGATDATRLLAGCTGDSGSGGDPESTDAGTPTSEATETVTETDADTSYSVTMEPMGTVEFDAPPERWVSYLSTYGDMGIALGKADSPEAFGEWNGIETLREASLTLFDRQRVADVIIGDH
ncbi:hypothetical protein [Halomicrobium mukohataei]|uniref:Uncharacterized protein n=1 Tax=Halomicrobium mukohataei TaxID=57705 RepID=A0A4D6KGM4_9EURY|nr:hypothetical protein [Halomicrobium mukohataei]QCD67234.1 hypothetical protein E5139_16435 [Halomicrobium mukohataei]